MIRRLLRTLRKPRCDDIHAVVHARGYIGVLWCIDDVKEIRPDLGDEQAWEVLDMVDDKADASLGISWDTLHYWADELFPLQADQPRGDA